MAVDERKAIAPRDRCAERRVDHLVSGKRDHARGERSDAGQEAIAATGHVASGRRAAHGSEPYHFPPSILLTLSDDQLLMPAQSGCRPTLSGEDSCSRTDSCAS